MRCEDVQDRLPEFVAGTLDDGLRAELQQHLDGGCAACRAEWAEIEEAVGLLCEDLPPVAPPPGLRTSVLAAAEQTLVTPARRADSPAGGWVGRVGYLVVAACALVLGMLASDYVLTGGDAPAPSAPDQIAADQEASRAEWLRRLAAAEREFGAPRANLAGMTAQSGDASFQVVLYYDRVAEQMHALAAGATPSEPGQTLWAWFYDQSGGLLFGGPLELLGGGQSMGVIDAAGDPAAVHEVVLTSEPPGAHDAPTGGQRARAAVSAGG